MANIPRVTKKRTAFAAPSDETFVQKPLEDKVILDEHEQEELIQSFRVENEKMNDYYQSVLTAVSIVIAVLFVLHSFQLFFTIKPPANMISRNLLLSPLLAAVSTAATPFIYRPFWTPDDPAPRSSYYPILGLVAFSLVPPLIAFLTTVPIQEPEIPWWISAEWWMTRGLWWQPLGWVGVHEAMVRSASLDAELEGLENAKYKLKGA